MTPKCIRHNCGKVQQGAGLCKPHYEASEHGYVDSRAAVEHIHALHDAGLSYREISRLTGLSRCGIRHLGKWGQGQMCLDTSQRIMAVSVPKVLVDGGATIPAVGTQRRIRALMALGWRQKDIGDALGIRPQSVSGYLTSDRVASSTATKIAELFDRWQLTPGPSPQTRSRAKKAGWHVPLVWDEDTIDDPAAKPHVAARIHMSSLERITELKELGVHGTEQIAQRLGIQPESVERVLYRQQDRDVA